MDCVRYLRMLELVKGMVMQLYSILVTQPPHEKVEKI